jgi:hypothetical protein
MDNSRLTQMTRSSVSRPTRWLLDNCIIQDAHLFHFGEGKAFADTNALAEVSHYCVAYDPNSPDPGKRDMNVMMYGQFDIVVCNFVLNVLEPTERRVTLEQILKSVKNSGVAYISVRTDKVNGTPHADGVITSRGTFQTQLSVEEWTEFFATIPLHTDNGYAIFALDRLMLAW